MLMIRHDIVSRHCCNAEKCDVYTEKVGIAGVVFRKGRRLSPGLLLAIRFVLLHGLLLLRPVRVGIMIRVLSSIVCAFCAPATASCAWPGIILFVSMGSMLAIIGYGLLLLLMLGALCGLLLLVLLLN